MIPPTEEGPTINIFFSLAKAINSLVCLSGMPSATIKIDFILLVCNASLELSYADRNEEKFIKIST